MEGLDLPFYSVTPGVLGSPSFLLPLWHPEKSCTADVAWLSPHHMSNPSPLPSHDDGAHAGLVAAGKNVLVGDGLGQNFCRRLYRILLRFFVWKVDSLLRSLSVILQHSEPYFRVESTQLWCSL